MNLIKSLETGNIKVGEIAILGAIWIFILHILSYFLMIPIHIIEAIFSINSPDMLFYIDGVSSLIIKIIMVKWLLKRYCKKDEVGYTKRVNISKNYFIYTMLIVSLFRIVFDNSIGIIVQQLPLNESIEEAFNELFKHPFIAIMSVCIVAPIYEEIIYRGVILKGLSIKYNDKISIVVSALLFAIMHMNIQQAINAFFLGIILGYLYLKTKSIYISIFAHFINNGVGIIVSSILTEFIKLSNNILVVQSIVTIVGIIFTCKIIIWFRKNEIIWDKEFLCETTE
ncbi:CPBP family intramembrane glutamic endopeptidase [Tepidibacter mesophilus]|uniref:CPBP family intramembrane glutamic endopeptidase n=1 Tax=Tepidibacter mesophilus TaxID=655607 RepID=UPI000C07688B|nr:type II CAAX endopeptidase family protein [Tepidibacter mesophilus]